MKEELNFFRSIVECWSTVIESQINLYYSITRLIVDNDREMKALRNNHNVIHNRLEKVERSLRKEGIQ